MRVFGSQEELGWPAYGTPLYEAAPLLSAPQRYLENGDVTEACRAFVLEHGGEEFFQQPGWMARLGEFHQQHSRAGYIMRTPDFLKFLAAEFEFSREQFRLHLGYAPRYFAYPWQVGSDISLRFAKNAGFNAIFGSDVDLHAERHRRAPMPMYGRTRREWLPYLPRAERTWSLGGLIKIDGLALGKLQQAATSALQVGGAVAAKLGPVAQQIKPLASHAGRKIRSATSRSLAQLASLPTPRKLLERSRVRMTPTGKPSPAKPG
jgi:hypothetical protein